MYFSGISLVFLWYFSGISLVFLWYFSGISLVFLWYFSGIPVFFHYGFCPPVVGNMALALPGGILAYLIGR